MGVGKSQFTEEELQDYQVIHVNHQMNIILIIFTCLILFIL